MKQITDQKPQTKSIGTTTGKSLPEKWVMAIFEKFRRRYLDLWTKRIGNDSREIEAIAGEWGRILGDLTGEEIKHGIESWDSEYPPNVFEFKKKCTEDRRSQAHQWYEFQKPKSRSDAKAEAKTSMEIMRKILSAKGPPPDRQDPAYIEWANYHRRVYKMKLIERVNQDGSFVLK